MSKTMVMRDPTRPVSVVHHEAKTYKPNRKGQFEVDDAHVEALRAHGLKLEGEPDDAKAAVKQATDLAAENERLKARIAELEGERAKK